MIDRNKVFRVTNRSASMVGYAIPEMHIRREFQPHETKMLTFDELEKLSFQDGGRRLMADYLLILEEEVTSQLNIPTEPEYYMTEAQIKELLATGSLDAFLDCLDFAPDGVIELLKKIAVDMPLNDVAKRKALLEKTGFDVDKALEVVAASKADDEPAAAGSESATPARRVQPSTPGRRTSQNYKVISKKQ